MSSLSNSLGRVFPETIDGKRLKPYLGAVGAMTITQPDTMSVPGTTGAGRPGGMTVSETDRADAARETRWGPSFPGGRARDHSARRRGAPDKLCRSWDELLDRLELRNGMTISFHHHLRDGDAVVNEAVGRIAARGFGDLVLAPTALFPTHDPLVPLVESGVIARIEGSMNGSLGAACTRGAMRGTAVLRSHGGRARAVERGELPIDLAIIAAPAADSFGNANGREGPSACGPLGYALPDSIHARQVVVVTDHLVPYPCAPRSIAGGDVDFVLLVDSIGDPSRIASGTTRLTRSPVQLLIAEMTASIVEEVGILREGFAFQAGAGGISLAVVARLAERMRKRGIRASFAHGGATGVLVNLLKEGLLGSIVDLQSFDLEAVRSLSEHPRHIESNPFDSYGPQGRGCAASMLDLAVLGATEIDLDFNVNVNTHSDGRLLHGIGGHQDAAASARCCIVTAPSFRRRIPIIRERVTTVSCPGEVVDVLVTERGIAVNPRRPDLLERAIRAGLPVKPIQDLMRAARDITGVPEDPRFDERVVAVVEWRDGTVIDVIRKVESETGSGKDEAI